LTIHYTGLAIVDSIATKDPSAIIYAGARDPVGGAPLLKALVAKYPGRVEIVKYVAGDKVGNDAIAAQIKAKHGRVDTVIANAGAVPCLYAIWYRMEYLHALDMNCQVSRTTRERLSKRLWTSSRSISRYAHTLSE
jgi:NAD(P)-dependent dehydrogenase (short-subunit alcohol dehydrogenase family)